MTCSVEWMAHGGQWMTHGGQWMTHGGQRDTGGGQWVTHGGPRMTHGRQLGYWRRAVYGPLRAADANDGGNGL